MKMMHQTAEALPTEANVFLEKFLEPFRSYLADPKISEICVNRPGGFWIERAGDPNMAYIEHPGIQNPMLKSLSHMIANQTRQVINEETPLLSSILPTGERIQIILPPAAPHGVALSIRKQVIPNLSLKAYAALGAFEQVQILKGDVPPVTNDNLTELLDGGNIMAFIEEAVIQKKNILISGGTSSGKTTLLNAILQSIPEEERIITIEDTSELRSPHKNWLPLIASRGDQGMSSANVQQLLEASLRLRPDRILLGELRGKEAFTFLRAVNTGHPGSITTVHADNPRSALQQICLMVQQSDIKMGQEQVMGYIRSIVDVVIQLQRVGGKRKVTDIWSLNQM